MGDVDAVDECFAFGWEDEGCEDLEGGGLACAVGTEESDAFS